MLNLRFVHACGMAAVQLFPSEDPSSMQGPPPAVAFARSCKICKVPGCNVVVAPRSQPQWSQEVIHAILSNFCCASCAFRYIDPEHHRAFKWPRHGFRCQYIVELENWKEHKRNLWLNAHLSEEGQYFLSA